MAHPATAKRRDTAEIAPVRDFSDALELRVTKIAVVTYISCPVQYRNPICNTPSMLRIASKLGRKAS